MTPIQIEQIVMTTVERSCKEINADIEAGIVPSTVNRFSELHDYVDANCYGGMCDEDGPWANDEATAIEQDSYLNQHLIEADAANEVQNRVDDWLRAGRPVVD